MNKQTRILGISGSLRRESYNRPEVMISNAPQRFDAEWNLTDEKTKDMIRRLLRSLVELTQRMQSNL